MSIARKVNRKLGSVTGYEFRRVGGGASASADEGRQAEAAADIFKLPRVDFQPPEDPAVDRLLDRPVFIICPPRSGSTLLRLLLGAHSQLHSLHELHFRRLQVAFATSFGKRAMATLGLDRSELEHLLWDRVMHREVVKSGKSRIVEKTPANAFSHKRIAACWPDAQFIFLLRHPMSSVASWYEHNPRRKTMEDAESDALGYMKAVERARTTLPGHTVRYEELTAQPEQSLKEICEFLGVGWEPAMLDYGAESELPWGFGDTREKVRSGQVQPGKELPAATEIPETLRGICESWGYT